MLVTPPPRTGTPRGPRRAKAYYNEHKVNRNQASFPNGPSWGEWVREQRGHRSAWTLAHTAKMDPSYISLIETAGYVPRREHVIRLAGALEVSVNEALLRAGYVPDLHPNVWAIILQGFHAEHLVPELGREVAGLADLSKSEQRRVAAFLGGVLAAGVPA